MMVHGEYKIVGITTNRCINAKIAMYHLFMLNNVTNTNIRLKNIDKITGSFVSGKVALKLCINATVIDACKNNALNLCVT